MMPLTAWPQAVEPLKPQFVGRDEVIDLTALAVVAGEHLFLLGPPGTAKSALVREFAGRPRPIFEYLLTRFSEPNEVSVRLTSSASAEARSPPSRLACCRRLSSYSWTNYSTPTALF